LVNLSETKKFITFSLVLIIWEVIPAFVIVLLFRVKRKIKVNSNEVINQIPSLAKGSHQKSVFLADNDQQENDSNDDLIHSDHDNLKRNLFLYDDIKRIDSILEDENESLLDDFKSNSNNFVGYESIN
jgi:hypothetical protein